MCGGEEDGGEEDGGEVGGGEEGSGWWLFSNNNNMV